MWNGFGVSYFENTKFPYRQRGSKAQESIYTSDHFVNHLHRSLLSQLSLGDAFMIKSLLCVLPTQGATVRGAFRHPGQVTYGLCGTKRKPTLCQRDNIRKYTINQFSWFVGDQTVMGSYLENDFYPSPFPSPQRGEDWGEGGFSCFVGDQMVMGVTLVCFNQKPISTMDRFVGSIYIHSIRILWVSEILLSEFKFISPFQWGVAIKVTPHSVGGRVQEGYSRILRIMKASLSDL